MLNYIRRTDPSADSGSSFGSIFTAGLLPPILWKQHHYCSQCGIHEPISPIVVSELISHLKTKIEIEINDDILATIVTSFKRKYVTKVIAETGCDLMEKVAQKYFTLFVKEMIETLLRHPEVDKKSKQVLILF